VEDETPDGPEQLYSVKEMAKILGVNPRTIYRMIDEKTFKNMLTIRRGERVRYRFTRGSLQLFIKEHGGNDYVQPEDRVKRAYHRRVVKGKHKKKAL
jgi:excisionase family DNA binding protein